MVVPVFETGLEHIVIHIGNGKARFNSRDPQSLKLQPGHRAGGILQKILVDFDGNLLPRLHLAVNPMGGNYFLGCVLRHFKGEYRGALRLCQSGCVAKKLLIIFLALVNALPYTKDERKEK